MQNSQKETILENTHRYLSHIIQGHDINFWQEELKRSYSQFFLFNENKWKIKRLEQSQETLIPDSLKKLLNFLDQLFENLLPNNYITELFRAIPEEDIQKIKTEHITQMICFAYSLDTLNTLMRNDLALTKEIIDHLHTERKKNKFYRISNILRIIKFHSIQFPVLRFLKDHKRGFVSKNSGKFILIINIFEAFLVDIFKGNFLNALSCIPLMIFSPNFKGLYLFSSFFKKGAPSKISPDGNGLEMTSPSHKKWSDLYQSWNFTFVCQFPQASYLLIKLLIPSVTGYIKNPSSYMHTRITALLLCLNFVDFATNNCQLMREITSLPAISPKSVSQQGRMNYASAIDYIKSIRNSGSLD